MTLAHVHILLNHFPTVGMIVGLGLYIVALIWKSDDLKRASLAVLVGLATLAIPVYMSGSAALEEITSRPDVSKAAVSAHQDAALLALAVMEVMGLVAWFGLWQYRRIARISKGIQATVTLLGLVTLLLMSNAANIGGEIRHPEILTKGGHRGAEREPVPRAGCWTPKPSARSSPGRRGCGRPARRCTSSG